MTTSPELAIPRWLGRCAPASAMTSAEVRSRLAALESRRLVSSRRGRATTPPKRVHLVTGEGQRAAGIGDARMQDA